MPEQEGATSLAIYPPQVVSTGRGLRACGWILLGLGGASILGRISAVANGL